MGHPILGRFEMWATRRRLQVTLSTAKLGARVRGVPERTVQMESASALIDEKIKELGDWRGKTLAKVREVIHEADPEIVEEWKWMGTPIWSHGGIVLHGRAVQTILGCIWSGGPIAQ